MSKIQILNEKQVNDYVAVLLPELLEKFNAKRDILKDQAKKEKDNFTTHVEVIKLKKEQLEKVDLATKLIEFFKQLQEFDKDLYIKRKNHWGELTTTDEEMKELLEEQTTELDELLLKLSKENLFVDQSWYRRDCMSNELRARLSMTAVNDFDKIKTIILESIDINSFFTKTITNN